VLAWLPWGVQEETTRLAAEVKDRDGAELQLRVGLNSGQVIAGEISLSFGSFDAVRSTGRDRSPVCDGRLALRSGPVSGDHA
jgi:class 3 adenylate cyclase